MKFSRIPTTFFIAQSTVIIVFWDSNIENPNEIVREIQDLSDERF